MSRRRYCHQTSQVISLNTTGLPFWHCLFFQEKQFWYHNIELVVNLHIWLIFQALIAFGSTLASLSFLKVRKLMNLITAEFIFSIAAGVRMQNFYYGITDMPWQILETSINENYFLGGCSKMIDVSFVYCLVWL